MFKKIIAMCLATVMSFSLGQVVLASNFNADNPITQVQFITDDDGNITKFYKRGNDYIYLDENNQEIIWATDELISISYEPFKTPMSRSSDWRYWNTAKYATRIDWENLNAWASVAEKLEILNKYLGDLLLIPGVLTSILPRTVYREETSYISKTYFNRFKTYTKVYKNSNYTGLIGTSTQIFNN